MPKLFKIGSYIIYFWSNEGNEPVHVHISQGIQTANATKIWLTTNGKCELCHNRSKISQHLLNDIMDFIETQWAEIIKSWKKYFGEVKFYC